MNGAAGRAQRRKGAGTGARGAAGRAIAVGILAFAAHLPALGNGFVWDDPIVLERQLPAFRSARDVLFPPHGIPQFSRDYYRPVTIASYLADRAGGGGPLRFHLTVVLLHATLSALLVPLIAGLLRDAGAGAGAGGAAVFAAAVFAVHPVHTESVCWMAGRSDVLAGLFTVAALLAHRCLRREAVRQPAVGTLVLLALGSKEVGIAALPLLVLNDWLLQDRASRRVPHPRRYAGALLAVLTYAVLRRAALGGAASGAVGAAPGAGAPVLAFVAYAAKLLWPFPLNAFIDEIPADPAHLAAGTAALAGAGWLAVRGRARSAAAFGCAWFALAILPALAVVALAPEVPMAERYLYVPSAGAAVVLAVLAVRAYEGRGGRRRAWVARAAAATLVAAAAASTALRARVWRDNLTLWTDTAAKARIDGTPLRSLGTALLQEGRLEEAERVLREALGRRNTPLGRQNVLLNLGTIALRRNRIGEAERLYRQAVAEGPPRPEAWYNLATVLLRRTDPGARHEARALLEKAARLSPLDPEVQFALAQIDLFEGRRTSGRERLRRALELGLSGPARKRAAELLQAGGKTG